MFDKIFSDKKVILELYNAIAQTDYTDESAVAAKRAVEECIEHGILKDILLRERSDWGYDYCMLWRRNS